MENSPHMSFDWENTMKTHARKIKEKNMLTVRVPHFQATFQCSANTMQNKATFILLVKTHGKMRCFNICCIPSQRICAVFIRGITTIPS